MKLMHPAAGIALMGLLVSCTTEFKITPDTSSDTTVEPDQNDGPPPGCGNGTVESGEDCDWGDENSDTRPNACRTNCRTPWCGDGVVDDSFDEECEEEMEEFCFTDCGVPGNMMCQPGECVWEDGCMSLEICINRCDDDGDGEEDCLDDDCECETDCEDGTDNDGDGREDCLDLDCMLADHCPTGCTPDLREDNDDASHASPVTPGHHPFLSLCPDDEDFYSFAAGVGQPLMVALLFEHAAGDIELELLAPTGDLAASSTTSGDVEMITYETEMAGTHRVRAWLSLGGSTPDSGNLYDMLIIF